MRSLANCILAKEEKKEIKCPFLMHDCATIAWTQFIWFATLEEWLHYCKFIELKHKTHWQQSANSIQARNNYPLLWT